jgi:CAAX prenyl protease-like protein
MLPAWSGFDARWWYGVQVSVVMLALILFWRHYQEINSGFGLSLSEAFLSVATGVAVFVLWINFDQPWAVIGESKGFKPLQADGALSWPLVVARVFGAAVVVPVMEELFWRSLVMRWLERSDFQSIHPARVGLRAIAMSSAVFGMEHTLWFAGVLAGLAYAWLYRRSGNLWSPIVAHAVTNLALGIWVVSTGNWQFW